MKGKVITNFSKKSAVLLLTACLCVGLIGANAEFAFAAQFNDTRGHWAESYINQASDLGIIGGYTDGSFRPDIPITRAEFAGMVNRTLGNNGTASITFPDVYYNDWYYNDVAKAVSATYVAGYADGYFRPKSPISRQEASVMLARIIPTSGANLNLRGYPDSTSVATWAYGSMAEVNAKGYMGSYKNDNKLHPTDSLTRAQTAKILCDIKSKESIMTSDPTIKSSTTLSNRIYANGVTVHKDLGNSSATLENCVVLGTLNVEGGGSNTVTLSNTRIANCAVQRTYSQVRLLAKGATTVSNLTASNDSILQTSGLSGGESGKGFSKITLNNSADTILRGSFPSVIISGSNTSLHLDSGTISNLNITSSGRGADITIPSGSNLTNAEVNAASSFYGNGTINTMRINVSGVTYETKPRSLSMASGINTPDEDDNYQDGAKFYPSYRSYDVGLNTDITITFETAMTLYNGGNISSSNISDFVTLRRGSSNGSVLNFSASVSSSKRVITIDPSYSLDRDTRYYITVDKNALKNYYGTGNTYLSSYFDTGTNSSSSSNAPFYPSNGDTDVPLDRDITLNFSSEVVRYNNGATLSNRDSYLQDAIEFRMDRSSGEQVPFSATINSNKTTITISPDSSLQANRTYYVGILSNRLKYATDGKAVPASSATWQTAGLPLLSNLTTSGNNENSFTVSGSSNVAGTFYIVALLPGEGTPTPAQVATGRNGNGNYTSLNNNTSIRSGYASSLAINNLQNETSYTVYGVIKDKAGNISPVMSCAGLTTPGRMAGLEILANDGSPLENFTFNSGTLNYGTGATKLYVPNGTTHVQVFPNSSNNVNAIVSISGIDTHGDVALDKSNGLGFLDLKVEYRTAPGKTPTTYQIIINERGSTAIERVDVKVDGKDPNPLFANGKDKDSAAISGAVVPPSIFLNVLGAEAGAKISILDAANGTTLAYEVVDAANQTFTPFHIETLTITNSKGTIKILIVSKDGVTTSTLTLNVEFASSPPPKS